MPKRAEKSLRAGSTGCRAMRAGRRCRPSCPGRPTSVAGAGTAGLTFRAALVGTWAPGLPDLPAQDNLSGEHRHADDFTRWTLRNPGTRVVRGLGGRRVRRLEFLRRGGGTGVLG